MKPLSLFSPVALLAVLLASGSPAAAQSSRLPDSSFGNPVRQLPPEFESKAKELRSAAPQQYDFSKSNLGDVLRFLATDAKISFISLPEDSPEAGKIITFSINGSPFSVLETLCKANGLTLLPEENGMWYIRPADDRELIGHSYQVKHNAMEKVETAIDNGNSGSGGGSSVGSIQSASVDLQGAKETFKVMPSELINDIRGILDLEPITYDANGGWSTMKLAPAGGAGKKDIEETNSNQLSTMHQPKVIWKSDSNTLYVVATRLQHLWVEGYLLAADKPQPLIAIEAKFIETSKDPTKELGIDWGGTLGNSGTFRQSTDLTYDATTKKYTSKDELIPNKEGGMRFDSQYMRSLASVAQLGRTAGWPSPVVLGGQDLSVRLRALLSDQDTKTTSYPRMVTLNNHEVVIRSVVNQPVLDGSATQGSGGGSTVTATKITYLPIGTVLNILPKKMDGDHIQLNIKITVSSIVGEAIISGNPYPVATSRVYNAPVEVNDGYTVAIGGLDEAKEQAKETGVPVLGKIPGLGYLFKTKSRQKNHKNLMMFITPMLIDAKGGGLSEEPVSVIPRRPGDEPKKPQMDNQGKLSGGVKAVPESITYLTRECDKIQATIDEGRQGDNDSRKLTDMKMALNKLDDQVASLTTEHPENSDVLTKASIDLAGLHERVSKMKREILKKDYY